MNKQTGERQFSVNAVIALIILLVLVFGWGFLAGSYEAAHAQNLSESTPSGTAPPRVRIFSPIPFMKNAVSQLPNFSQVFVWHLQNRVWLPLLIAAILAAVLYGGFVMKRLDRELKKPYKVKYRKR